MASQSRAGRARAMQGPAWFTSGTPPRAACTARARTPSPVAASPLPDEDRVPSCMGGRWSRGLPRAEAPAHAPCAVPRSAANCSVPHGLDASQVGGAQHLAVERTREEEDKQHGGPDDDLAWGGGGLRDDLGGGECIKAWAWLAAHAAVAGTAAAPATAGGAGRQSARAAPPSLPSVCCSSPAPRPNIQTSVTPPSPVPPLALAELTSTRIHQLFTERAKYVIIGAMKPNTAG